jgi:hypothetical protein
MYWIQQFYNNLVAHNGPTTLPYTQMYKDIDPSDKVKQHMYIRYTSHNAWLLILIVGNKLSRKLYQTIWHDICALLNYVI